MILITYHQHPNTNQKKNIQKNREKEKQYQNLKNQIMKVVTVTIKKIKNLTIQKNVIKSQNQIRKLKKNKQIKINQNLKM